MRRDKRKARRRTLHHTASIMREGQQVGVAFENRPPFAERLV